MRNSNGVTPMTGRTSRRGLGIAVAGGAAVLVLASGGIAMASPLPGHGASGSTFARPSWAHVVTTAGRPGTGNKKSGVPTPAPVQGQPGWNRVSNNPGTTGAGSGKRSPSPAPTPAPVQGQPGWNRVSNNPGTTGVGNGKGGQGLPGSSPTPAPVTTGGQGGALGGIGGDLGGQGGQGGQGGPGGALGGVGGQAGLGGQGGLGLPGSAPAPVTTGGQGGQAATG